VLLFLKGLCPLQTGRDIPIKRGHQNALFHHIMHEQAPWDNTDSGSYLISDVKQNQAWLAPGWESALGFISMSSLFLTPLVSTLCVQNGTH
jgi:hypothetical protein